VATKQDKKNGTFTFSCDFCDERIKVAAKSFSDAWAGLKKDGWRAFKDDQTGEWKHKCPDWRTHKAHEGDEPEEEVPF